MDPRVFHKVSYGMYVVGSRGAGDRVVVNAQISNTVIQVSARPEQVSVALHRDNYTHELVAASGVYSACILRQDAPMEHIGRFGFSSGRDGDKLAGIEHRTGVTGSPIVLPHSVGVIEVQVKQSVELSTHTLFIGEVVGTEMLGGGEPLTYEHYHLVKKGKSPERAPVTFVEHDEDDAPSAAPGRYRCGVCGYTHDEGSDGSFDALPEDWKCPVCGASKGVFAPA